MTKHIIYGLHLSTDNEIRYVGRSTRSANERLRRHIRDTYNGSLIPVHTWMREVGVENVRLLVLEVVHDEGPAREAAWISNLRTSGNRLTNVHNPSNSPKGPWSEEQRRNHKGENNPYYGRKHSEETRAKMRASAPRTSGPAHHLYGVKVDPEEAKRKAAKAAEVRWTPEAREAQRQKMLKDNPFMGMDVSGQNNPFYGKTHNEDTRARMAESAKSRPPISEETRRKLRLRNHKRWHVNRGVTKSDCEFC